MIRERKEMYSSNAYIMVMHTQTNEYWCKEKNFMAIGSTLNQQSLINIIVTLTISQ
jgi:hypothetical protein